MGLKALKDSFGLPRGLRIITKAFQMSAFLANEMSEPVLLVLGT